MGCVCVSRWFPGQIHFGELSDVSRPVDEQTEMLVPSVLGLGLETNGSLRQATKKETGGWWQATQRTIQAHV